MIPVGILKKIRVEIFGISAEISLKVPNWIDFYMGKQDRVLLEIL